MSRATRILSTLALGAAFALAFQAPSIARADEAAAAPSVEDISAKVQAFYNQTKTFQAQFNQVYKVKLHQRTKKSSGRVTFEKPGKMHWTYDENGNHVVSDGKTLKVFEKENNQMFEQAVEKSQYPAALSFLMGQGDLSKSFNLKQLDAATMKFEGGYVLEGTPKDATPAYQKVLFYIDRETSQVRRVIILDAQGNRNEFTFKSPTVNKDLPTGVFEFTPPSGTQIVHPE
jgi:outer membrane lipoprotein carrier protein